MRPAVSVALPTPAEGDHLEAGAYLMIRRCVSSKRWARQLVLGRIVQNLATAASAARIVCLSSIVGSVPQLLPSRSKLRRRRPLQRRLFEHRAETHLQQMRATHMSHGYAV